MSVVFAGMPEGLRRTVNTAKDGQVNILVDSAAPLATAFAARIVRVIFDIANGARAGDNAIAFGDASFSDAYGNPLMANYDDGIMQSSALGWRLHASRRNSKRALQGAKTL